MMRDAFVFFGIVVVIILAIGGLVWWLDSSDKPPTAEWFTRDGRPCVVLVDQNGDEREHIGTFCRPEEA